MIHKKENHDTCHVHLVYVDTKYTVITEKIHNGYEIHYLINIHSYQASILWGGLGVQPPHKFQKN